MNKFQHDNLSTAVERKNMRTASIHPRVRLGRAYDKKSNTCKVPREGTKAKLVAALKAHLAFNSNDAQSWIRLTSLGA